MLGDVRCGVDLDDPAFRAAGSVTALSGDRSFTASGLGGFAAGWYLHLCCVLVTALLYLRFDPRSYPQAMPVAGWDRYRVVNVEYRGQVVCQRR